MPSEVQPWPGEASFHERWAVARRVALRWRKRLLALPNVESVNVGLEHAGRRTARGRRGSLRRVELARQAGGEALVPCVFVVVTRKWSDTRRRRGSLPDFLPAFMTVRGRRRRVAVPVDVVARAPSALHGQWECESTDFQRRTLVGMATAFVRFAGGQQQYLLGCHHVLALTEVERPPASGAIPSYTVAYQGSPVGTLARLPNDYESCDAALAACGNLPQITFTSPKGRIKLRGVVDPANLPTEYWVLTQNGARRAQLAGFVSHGETYYRDAAPKVLTFQDVIYSSASDGRPFRPGDSGAALVTDDGLLIGIHYAGTPGGGVESFALPAWKVVKAFGKILQLTP